MSNRDPDNDYSQLDTAIRFVIGQSLKNIHTAIPATVLAYDASAKRATVQPAINLLLTDDTTRPRAPISNVPVLHPTGGGFVIHFPIQPGDPVMLLFSQRGIAKFKKTYKLSDPDRDAILSAKDAVVIPGFGGKSISTSSTDLSIQNETGTLLIRLRPDNSIQITAPAGVNITGDLTVQGNAAFSGDTLTHNDVNVGSDHTHSGVYPGDGTSGPPT